MIYTIKKNRHRSRWIPKLTFRKSIKGTFKFIGDVSYDGNLDTNKLIGLSDSYHHHVNSIRLGWRWNNGLELMAICYRNGNREIRPICFIEPDVDYEFSIMIHKYTYQIMTAGQIQFFTRKSKWWFVRYWLFPFFGGQSKSPKEFKIEINTKKK